MKELKYLPLEFKPDKSVNGPLGRYLIPHPLVRAHFFEVMVSVVENKYEKVSAKIVILVSRNKSLFRSSARYLTFEEAQMIREVFFDGKEEIIQYQQEIPDELMAGDKYTHLFKIHPMANYKEFILDV